MTTASVEPQISASHAALEELFASSSALQHVFRAVLIACAVPQTLEQIDTVIHQALASQVTVFAPSSIRCWLEQAEGLSIIPAADDAAEMRLTTESGVAIVAATDPASRLDQLVNANQESREIYRQILSFCLIPCDKQQIEEMIYQQNLLPRGKSPYPTAFLGELETIGAVRWNGQWSTTDAGKKLC